MKLFQTNDQKKQNKTNCLRHGKKAFYHNQRSVTERWFVDKSKEVLTGQIRTPEMGHGNKRGPIKVEELRLPWARKTEHACTGREKESMGHSPDSPEEEGRP